MRSVRKTLLAIPIALLFSAAGWAQTSMISGDVKGEDGKPLQNAQIKIERLDMKGAYNGAKTNKQGHYVYTGLPLGKFKVTLVVDGKDVTFFDNVSTAGGATPEINFDLQKMKAAAAAAGGAAPAGGRGEAPAPAPEANRGMSAAQKAEFEKQKKDQEAQMAKNKELQDAFNGGMTALQAQDWDGAVEKLVKSSELGPTQPVVWANLAEAYKGRALKKSGAEQAADIEKASEAYRKAIELKADDGGYHNNFALVLALAKKFDEAQAELGKAATLDPATAGKSYYNLGVIFINSGQNDPALSALKKAVDATPPYPDAYYQMGIVLLNQATTTADGKIVPAPGTAEAFQKYIELKPDGKDVQSAKDLLATLGSSVETSFDKPGQKKQPAPKKK